MKNRLRREVRTFFSDIDLSNFVGVTLTMKQLVDGEKLTTLNGSQNLRHFRNLLNRRVFGKRYQRFGLELQIIPVLENSSKDRLHYHLVIEHPSEFDYDGFKQVIETCWTKTRFGHREIHIDESIDTGWMNYITKFRTLDDTVDWENVHLDRRV